MEEKVIEILDVQTLKDGVSAVEIHKGGRRGRIFKIADIMLGVGHRRKPIKYTKFFLKPDGDFRAELLSNGKLRIVG